ncbi:hypothetical protein MP638_007303 [Amoeboaphelidium occidentale]|nr:hypothetical protein MP638_007303 [Amoeboaphelidium occidentale]
MTNSQSQSSSSSSSLSPKAQPKISSLSVRTREALPTQLRSSQRLFTFPEYQVRQRMRLLVKNSIIGLSIASFGVFVYGYSMWAVKQDDLTDAFLAELERQNK